VRPNSTKKNKKIMKISLSLVALTSTIGCTIGADIDSTMPAVVALGVAPEGDFSQVDYQTDHSSPETKADHAIIQVTASSVNPVDWKILSGHAIRYPKVLGFDVAGTLMNDECSPRLNQGDKVWADVGNSDWGKAEYAQLGAYAGYVLAHCDQVGLAPPSINLTEAGVLPLVGLTSYEALRFGFLPLSLSFFLSFFSHSSGYVVSL
jgi:NADPH:quinone reductase-like Zn-dependent oxidoreductase